MKWNMKVTQVCLLLWAVKTHPSPVYITKTPIKRQAMQSSKLKQNTVMWIEKRTSFFCCSKIFLGSNKIPIFSNRLPIVHRNLTQRKFYFSFALSSLRSKFFFGIDFMQKLECIWINSIFLSLFSFRYIWSYHELMAWTVVYCSRTQMQNAQGILIIDCNMVN